MTELAERIEALRAANTVEAEPERTVRMAARAERPVTARIRYRMGEQAPAVAAEEPMSVEVKPEPVRPPEPLPVVISMQEPVEPENSHASAVVKRRQERAEPLRLFRRQALTRDGLPP